MSGKRELPEELLLAYASGHTPEPVSLVVASHLTYAPEAREAVEAYEAVGGALLEDLEPQEMAGDALARTLARLDDEVEEAEEEAPGAAAISVDGIELPQALRRYVGPDINALKWTRRMKGVEDVELNVSPDYRTRLMRIQCGTTVPQHSHKGDEITLVLAGAYEDETGHYGAGDLQIADEETDHKPTAVGGETCLCLVVRDAPIRMTGKFGRMFNPIVRY